MERTAVALPEDAYLKRIGEIAYTTSSVEWTLLGDLSRLQGRIPETLTLPALEPETTGRIAGIVDDAAEVTLDGPVREYLLAVAGGLKLLAQIRNDVLHARPATHFDGQRLLRAEVVKHKTTGRRFWIDDAWLDENIKLINDQIDAINAIRPPFAFA